jgi:hypothetical protein
MGKKSFPYPYPSGQIPDGYRVPVPKLPSLMVVNAGAGAGNWNPRMLMGRMVDQGIVPYTIFLYCTVSKDIHIKTLDLPTCYLR